MQEESFVDLKKKTRHVYVKGDIAVCAIFFHKKKRNNLRCSIRISTVLLKEMDLKENDYVSFSYHQDYKDMIQYKDVIQIKKSDNSNTGYKLTKCPSKRFLAINVPPWYEPTGMTNDRPKSFPGLWDLQNKTLIVYFVARYWWFCSD